MRVNLEKGVWFCPACNIGGDVFTFLEKVEGLSFPEALAHLGLADQRKPTRARNERRKALKQASANLVLWALTVTASIGTRMRELGHRAHVARQTMKLLGADQNLLHNVVECASREWDILSNLEMDILDPKQTASLWEARDEIEQLVICSSTYSDEEIERVYPPLTSAYKQRLQKYVRGAA